MRFPEIINNYELVSARPLRKEKYMDTDFDDKMLKSIVDNIIGGILVFEIEDDKINPLYINEGFYRMLGYTKKEMSIMMRNLKANIITEDLPIVEQGIQDILNDNGSVEVEFRTVTMDGGIRWIQIRANLYSRSAKKATIVAIVLDATERKNVEEELMIQSERYNLLYEYENEHIFDYNAKTDVLTIKMSHKSNISKDIILKDYIKKLEIGNVSVFHTDDLSWFLEVQQEALKSPRHDRIDIQMKLFKEMEDFEWFRISFTSIMGPEGYITRIVGRITNINEAKLKEIELKTKAEKDSLTGIYNKGATRQLIEQAIKSHSRDGSICALFIVDLDNFKEVNDKLGHAYGDEVLKDAAQKLSNNFKGADVVGRIGGDEFLIFMRDIIRIDNAQTMASKIVKALRNQYTSGDETVIVSSSIGIALYPKQAESYTDLFEKADKALYTAKAKGKNTYEIYDPDVVVAYSSNRI